MAHAPTILKVKMPSMTILRDSDADGTVERNIVGGPCRLLGIHFKNGGDDYNFLRLYDSLDPHNGVTAPDFVFPVSPGSTSDETPDDIPLDSHGGVLFETGLSFATVGTAAGKGASNTANPASACTVIFRVLEGLS